MIQQRRGRGEREIPLPHAVLVKLEAPVRIRTETSRLQVCCAAIVTTEAWAAKPP